MLVKLLRACSVLVVVTLGSTAAVAAGMDGMAPSMPAIVGYIEAHAAWERGSSTHYDPNADGTFAWSDYQIGGSGRLAVAALPNLSVQGDLWQVVAVPPNGLPSVDQGVGGHLTWRSGSDDVFMFGVLGSVGSGAYNSGLVGNAGLEAVLNIGKWRLYGQTGMTGGLSGDVKFYGERDVYGTLSVNVFLTPNFFVSGNIGADRWTQNNGDSSPEMSWGGKVEFKPDRSAVSVFAAYEGFGFRSNYAGESDYDKGQDHIALVGVRVPLGVTSLLDLQHAVGLADLNPLYGDLLNR